MTVESDTQVAIVICTGSYHTPVLYQPFMQALISNGFEAHCPQRLTCDLSKLNVGDVRNPDFDRGPPPEGYPTDLDDAVVVRQLLHKLIDQENKNVLLFGHATGAVVATQAAIPELHYRNRQSQNQKGGVIGIFYVGGMVVPLGESVHTFFHPKDGSWTPPPFVRFYKHGKEGLATPTENQKYLLVGLNAEEVQKWSSEMTASPVNTGVLTNDIYSTLPCGYLVLDHDTCLPPAYQEKMISMQSRPGNEFRVYHAPSGQSPQLTWIEGLVGKVMEFTQHIQSLQ
ncbi:uncharacterized protein N7484_010712 [Penicillium longicatenatum]|uniref:uncharacterized protein n=1 Tax=Penicillium longicatenatum TaxID=1561947 RepID=UPI002546A686|nr:uncharacterized protein N7484_010712 [Penicillium longicatenatum]KAJ5630612.1 hypothetical protein N7484_010712 [Penicillium longicatenatum]